MDDQNIPQEKYDKITQVNYKKYIMTNDEILISHFETIPIEIIYLVSKLIHKRERDSNGQ